MGCCLSCFGREGYEKLDQNSNLSFIDNKDIQINSLGIPEDEEILSILEQAGNDQELHLSDEELEIYLQKIK